METGKRLIRCALALALSGMLFLGASVYGMPEAGRADDATSACLIRVTYPADENLSLTDDLDEIEKAVNEITANEIGVMVELIPVDTAEAKDNYFLWLARGDAIDLMLIRDQDIAAYIDSGFLNPLNSYLKWNGNYLLALEEQTGGMLAEGAQQQGRSFGAANLSAAEAVGYGLWVSASVLEESGIEWDAEHVYSLQEIDRILGQLKAAFPESYPLGQITAGEDGTAAEKFISMGDPMGTMLSSGTVYGENDTVVSPFSTPEYREYLFYMRRWYEAGYILPESVTFDAAVQPLLETGKILAYPYSSFPGTMDMLLGHETDYVCLRTTETVKRQDYSLDGFWTVPVTANYPEEAVRFLDLLYSSEELMYLLNYGIEGEHYEITDAENREMTWVYDDSGNISGFYNPMARIGDLRNLCIFGKDGMQEQREEWNSSAREGNDRYEGFVFSTESVRSEIDRVEQVIRDYAPVLEGGSVEWEAVYEEFQLQLEEAGLSRVIAEKQSQLDGWLAQKDDGQG